MLIKFKPCQIKREQFDLCYRQPLTVRQLRQRRSSQADASRWRQKSVMMSWLVQRHTSPNPSWPRHSRSPCARQPLSFEEDIAVCREVSIEIFFKRSVSSWPHDRLNRYRVDGAAFITNTAARYRLKRLLNKINIGINRTDEHLFGRFYQTCNLSTGPALQAALVDVIADTGVLGHSSFSWAAQVTQWYTDL